MRVFLKDKEEEIIIDGFAILCFSSLEYIKEKHVKKLFKNNKTKIKNEVKKKVIASRKSKPTFEDFLYFNTVSRKCSKKCEMNIKNTKLSETRKTKKRITKLGIKRRKKNKNNVIAMASVNKKNIKSVGCKSNAGVSVDSSSNRCNLTEFIDEVCRNGFENNRVKNVKCTQDEDDKSRNEEEKENIYNQTDLIEIKDVRIQISNIYEQNKDGKNKIFNWEVNHVSDSSDDVSESKSNEIFTSENIEKVDDSQNIVMLNNTTVSNIKDISDLKGSSKNSQDNSNKIISISNICEQDENVKDKIFNLEVNHLSDSSDDVNENEGNGIFTSNIIEKVDDSSQNRKLLNNTTSSDFINIPNLKDSLMESEHNSNEINLNVPDICKEKETFKIEIKALAGESEISNELGMNELCSEKVDPSTTNSDDDEINDDCVITEEYINLNSFYQLNSLKSVYKLPILTPSLFSDPLPSFKINSFELRRIIKQPPKLIPSPNCTTFQMKDRKKMVSKNLKVNINKNIPTRHLKTIIPQIFLHYAHGNNSRDRNINCVYTTHTMNYVRRSKTQVDIAKYISILKYKNWSNRLGVSNNLLTLIKPNPTYWPNRLEVRDNLPTFIKPNPIQNFC